MKTAKFKIGDHVTFTLRGQRHGGRVVECYRLLHRLDARGRVETARGIAGTLAEQDCANVQLPCHWVGDVFEIEHPESDFGTFTQKAYTARYRLHSWGYSVVTDAPARRYGIPEHKLRRA